MPRLAAHLLRWWGMQVLAPVDPGDSHSSCSQAFLGRRIFKFQAYEAANSRRKYSRLQIAPTSRLGSIAWPWKATRCARVSSHRLVAWSQPNQGRATQLDYLLCFARHALSQRTMLSASSSHTHPCFPLPPARMPGLRLFAIRLSRTMTLSNFGRHQSRRNKIHCHTSGLASVAFGTVAPLAKRLQSSQVLSPQPYWAARITHACAQCQTSDPSDNE